jgi:hypothetical protein
MDTVTGFEIISLNSLGQKPRCALVLTEKLAILSPCSTHLPLSTITSPDARQFVQSGRSKKALMAGISATLSLKATLRRRA